MDMPRWLNDEPEVIEWLNGFLNKLDTPSGRALKNPPRQPVRFKDFPTLAKKDEAADRLWSLICQLAPAILDEKEIKSARQNNLDPIYDGIKVRLAAGGEAILRQWFERPAKPCELTAWRSLVEQHSNVFSGACDSLLAKPVAAQGRAPEEVMEGFVRISNYFDLGLTLRQLSACCFWGESKFLEGRESLVRELYPGIAIQPRPVVLNVFLPQCVRGVLLIENLDSYHRAISGSPKAALNQVLVYCSGFKGGAQRIRTHDGVSFHYQGDMNQREMFECWWFEKAWKGPSLTFWGDLDFEGMRIYSSIKQHFPELTLWDAGYAPMQQLLESGGGHNADQAKKTDQSDPGETGCAYADGVLLPLLRDKQRFCDQEFVI